jgi:uncharacterized protein
VTMTLFAVWASDRTAALAERERVRPAHRARLREPAPHPVRVVLAGPTLADDGTMNGTLLVVEAEHIEVVRAFVDGDPYIRAGVYDSVEIRAFACGLGPLAPPAANPSNTP